MAYSIGQYRCNGIFGSDDSYKQQISTTSQNNPLTLNRYMTNNNNDIYEYNHYEFYWYGEINDVLTPSENYYLKFSVPTLPSGTEKATCIITLQNTTHTQKIVLDTFIITNIKTQFQCPISPQFDGKIRIWLPYYKNIPNNNQSQLPQGVYITHQLYQIKNIISSLASNKPIKKIGIQGAPYLPVWINNNCIRLNKNGIYELHNGIDITSVGVFPANNSFFLIDYEY